MQKRHEDKTKAIQENGHEAQHGAGQSRRHRGKKYSIYVAVIVSLIIHTALLITLPMLLNDDPHRTRAEALRVWLTTKPPAPKKENTVDKRTVVQAMPMAKIERPKDAKFLSDQDQSTQREMRAKAAPPSEQQQKQTPSDAMRNLEQRVQAPSAERGVKLARKASKNDPLGLRPNLKEQFEAVASNDSEHLPDVDEGDHTELNAWQWRHAPFFNRIKARIGQIWSPQSQIARYDPQGVMLGQKDRVSVLRVSIDRSGNLHDLSLVDSSGVTYLDEEALRTFRAAAPFLYPPQELFGDDELFTFNFAFHLYLDRGFSFGFNWGDE